MNEAVTHQMMMLRPMQAGLSGYARLQGEAGRQLVQINLRGMQPGDMRVFWYAGEGLVREVGRSAANQRGEASLSAEVPMDAAAPRRLMALLITDGGDRPRPLAIGLCTAQSSGSLMDAKNALLALCDRLGREKQAQQEQQAQLALQKAMQARTGDRIHSGNAGDKGCEDDLYAHEQTKACETSKAQRSQAEQDKPAGRNGLSGKEVSERNAAASPAAPAPSTRNSNKHSSPSDLPREVFLPAIEARSRPERRRRREDQNHQPAKALRKAAPEISPEASPAAEPPERSTHPLPVKQSNERQANPAHASPAPAQAAVPTSHHEVPHTGPSPRPQKRPVSPPADQLPALQWPAAFQPLAVYFDRYPPLRLMDWPGWRFVHVPQGKGGLWIGYRQQDGRIAQVAYALPAEAQPPEGQTFRPARTADGQTVQLLVLRA